MNRIVILIALVFGLVSCEKDIEFKLDDAEPKLVVEGSIENDEPPVVVLTRSVGYFSNLNLQTLAGSFVHNAEVYVSNGLLTHRLKEYAVPVAPGLSLYYYSIDSSDLATAFEGEFNKSYSLKIISEGKEYNASTTIPFTTRVIDSIWWRPAPPTAEPGKVVVMVKATDPPGFGDYIRYYTSINGGPFLPGENSVYDDLFIDGTTYEVQVEPGVDRNVGDSDDDFFTRGDTVVFKLSNIDRSTFNFWRTWEFSIRSIGNPFSTPIKVLGNISNGALGYFGGYATQYRTLIIPQ